MPKRPAEIFGHPIDVMSDKSKSDRKKHRCPFAERECDKKSRLIRYPMGVCSVQYGDRVIALSPDRFLQGNTVFKDIADHHFQSRNDILVFSEVGVPGVGNFDYVMVRHKALSSDIEDFVVVEFQTGQTTSTGKLVNALATFMKGEDISAKTFGFGINFADIWKRSFTQVLNKGIVLENWGHKVYWVVQEPVYQDLEERYNLQALNYSPNHSAVFALYDLRRSGEKFELYRTRLLSSSVDDLFSAFRSNRDIPSKDTFLERLRNRMKANLGLKIELGQG